MELKAKLYNQILEFSNKGEKYFEQREFDKAIEAYEKALELVPFPQFDWEAATWINVAIGDSYFLKQEYEKALDYFYDANNGPNAVANPFINLRIGQCEYELNHIKKSEDYLLRAFMLDGEDVFKGEDAKFLKSLKKRFSI